MDESSGVNVSAAGSDPGRSVQEASNSPGCPIEPRNDIPPGPRKRKPVRTVGMRAPSPLDVGEGCNQRGRTGQMHPPGSPGSEKVAWWKGTVVKGGRSRSPAKTHPYGKATRITGTPGSRGVGPRLAAEVVGAVMGEQQQAPGAKDLWARVAQATGGSESMAFGPDSSRGRPRYSVPAEERTRYNARTKAAVNQQAASFRGGVRVSRTGQDLGMPPLIGPRLSPAGGKPHGRWDGGGEETGKATMDSGDARLCRKRQECAPGTSRGDVPRLPATRSAMPSTLFGQRKQATSAPSFALRTMLLFCVEPKPTRRLP